VLDYLCNRLYSLPERDVERYLSQLTQLCIQRPGSLLDRVIERLCAKSLRIAVKVRLPAYAGVGARAPWAVWRGLVRTANWRQPDSQLVSSTSSKLGEL